MPWMLRNSKHESPSNANSITDAHAWRVYYDINDDEEESSHSSSNGEEPNSSEEDLEFDPLHDSEYEMDEDHGLKMHQLNMIEKIVMKT
ncbi:hypothetical protein Leryth_012509 [Lithospermum erythrorhizon]|nr:hypothetical protein Leryth_012509 [Lithospermum erythrorhizon]